MVQQAGELFGNKDESRDSANMPQLQEDSSVLPMHGIYDVSPCVDLLRGMNAWRISVPLSHWGNLSRLRNDETCRCTLRVVCCRKFAMHAVWIGAGSASSVP